MGLKITIEGDLKKTLRRIRALRREVVVNGMRMGINRGLRILRTESVAEIRKQRALRAKTVRGRTQLLRARGSTLDALEGKILVDDRTIGLVHFVKGSQKPKDQKGRPVAKRTRLRVQITKGRTRQRRRDFIIIGKRGKPVVLRRRGQGKNSKLTAVRLPGLHVLFNKPGFTERIVSRSDPRIRMEITRAMRYQLKKLK